jgi:phage baseplate assembly protein W
MSTTPIDIIGVGWKFPIRVTAKGGLSYSNGPDRIQDAIWIILSTSLGERVMREDFGAGVNDYVFQSNSDVVRARLAAAVSAALTKWEPRITQVNVAAQQGTEPSQVLIVVDYQISSTNELFIRGYPLYLRGGVG